MGRRFKLVFLMGTLLAGAIYAVVSDEFAIFKKLAPLTPPENATPAQTSFRNVQYLKHQTVSELYTTMAYFDRSLGVACYHCHATTTYDDDTNENKKRARRMIEMVKSVNSSYFEGERVLCYTCHQGGTLPPRIPLASMTAGD